MKVRKFQVNTSGIRHVSTKHAPCYFRKQTVAPSKPEAPSILIATVHCNQRPHASYIPPQTAMASACPEVKEDVSEGPPLETDRHHYRGVVRSGKRKRRERLPNWETSETFALVKAKRAEHDEVSGDLIRWSCSGERGGDSTKKWRKVADVVWNDGASVVFRNAESCKDKWGQMNGEYKKIRDYERTRHALHAAGSCGGPWNVSYWDLPSGERQALHLPKTFHSRKLYECMDEFLNENAVCADGSRSHPSETPANIRDSLCVAPIASRTVPEVAAQNGVRLVLSLPAGIQRQKQFAETEVAAAIRDRLARLRGRIEVVSPRDTDSPKTEDTEGLQFLEGKEYACIQAAMVGGGSVGLVTLDRPKALNALSHALMLELVDALQTFDASTQVGAIVVTAKGEAFSAGIDVKEMQDKTSFVASARVAHHWNAVTAIRKPLIAAMNGYAVGGGCELAMMCDIILAGERAQFGQPEINLGTIPGMGGSQRLIREVGKSRAMEMILTGKHFMNAHEAAQRGLVSRVVLGDDDTLVAEAVSLAREISKNSKPVVALAKEIVNTAYEVGLTEGVKKEHLVCHATFGLEDHKEGMAAFLERRCPAFQDK